MPLSPTPAQSAASRSNGAASRGPTTPEGRARSSRNGTAHGLTSRTFALLPGEDPAEHEALLAAYAARHCPADPAEELWVGQAVFAAWRLRRLEAVEARALADASASDAVADAASGREEERRSRPSLATIVRYRARIERDHRHALAELDRLRASRPRLDPAFAFAARNVRTLRWVADHEERKAAAAEAERGMVEPETAPSPAMAAAPERAVALIPQPQVPAVAPGGAAEPETPPAAAPSAPAERPRNRAERRRLAALLRHRRAA